MNRPHSSAGLPQSLRTVRYRSRGCLVRGLLEPADDRLRKGLAVFADKLDESQGESMETLARLEARPLAERRPVEREGVDAQVPASIC